MGHLKSIFILLLVFFAAGQFAHAQAPSIFFTDLTSGPNSGGESVSGFAGAYVTLYGNGFGVTQGSSSVTLNGANCLRIVSWGGTWLWYQTVVVQLGPSCASGNFAVTTSAGSSKGVPFTVRSGNIRCVSTSGSDSNPGTFSGGCWKTVKFAMEGNGGNPEINSGDIIYAQNGTGATVDDGQGWSTSILLRAGGSSWSTPMALVAYPGATVTIGSSSGASYGLRNNGTSFWVFAGLTLTGNISGAESVDTWRMVGNDDQCPKGTTPDACMEGGANNFIYGNHIHNAGFSGSTKQYHALYLTTDGNHNDIGWNSIHDVQGCRGILFHSTGGSQQFDLHVHDNLIFNVRCDGINFATVDPSKGTVEAYNNVIYHVGTGPDPSDGESNYACIYSPDSVDSGAFGSGVIQVYNNTMYDCGPGGSGSGAHGAINKDGGNPAVTISARNNVVQLLSNEGAYLQGTASQISGSNNVWFGSSSGAPSQTTGNITSNPMFVSTSTPDFHLLTGSPAIDAGVTISSLAWDHDGVSRPQGASYDVGAYEFPSGAVARPAPPTNLSVVVK